MKIAITGHRPNRMHIGVTRVEQRLMQVLRMLKRASRANGPRRERLIAISALAEGSDRLFAAAALDMGFRLQVLLPFKSANYETTFGEASTTTVYRALLGRAETIEELPGSLADSTAAYEAVGHATVDRCDVLVTVWDGKPAAGRGGTPEILQYAIDHHKPIIWIDAARDRPPALLQNSAALGQRAVSLRQLALRGMAPTGVRIARALAKRRVLVEPSLG
jgi:hypothetical protein